MARVSLDATFTALADPTRRAIVTRLAQGDATVSELAAPFDMSLPGISKHLKVLDNALEGKQFLTGEYTLADAHVNSILDWLKHMKVDFAGYPHIAAWSQRCAARPAFKAAMERESK